MSSKINLQTCEYARKSSIFQDNQLISDKLIEKENLLSKGCSGADFLQAIHNLAERYGITDEMTKNFLVYNFQKEKTQNGKKR